RDQQILLLQRQNTGFEDGNFSVVAGHIEAGETARSATCREASEEAGLTIRESSLRLFHVVHKLADQERIAFFFICDAWSGEPVNREPDKCSQLAWFPLATLPSNTVPYVRQAIRLGMNGAVYSESGWSL
ncbi:MAG: NUDIX domain-containing protein, partial [Pseudomonadota bacterium]